MQIVLPGVIPFCPSPRFLVMLDIDHPLRQHFHVVALKCSALLGTTCLTFYVCTDLAPPRYLRHFNMLALAQVSDDNLTNIFRTILDWHLRSQAFPAAVVAISPQVSR
jgi:hypothetical protein